MEIGAGKTKTLSLLLVLSCFIEIPKWLVAAGTENSPRFHRIPFSKPHPLSLDVLTHSTYFQNKNPTRLAWPSSSPDIPLLLSNPEASSSPASPPFTLAPLYSTRNSSISLSSSSSFDSINLCSSTSNNFLIISLCLLLAFLPQSGPEAVALAPSSSTSVSLSSGI